MFLEEESPVSSRQSPVKGKTQSLALGAQGRQGGWLMPMAAFIIVVMGLLAAGMARVGSQTSIAGAQEQVTVQTFYAAESGAQYAMNRLFYDTTAAVSRTSASNACTDLSGTVLNLDAVGMLDCQVVVSCEESVDAGDTTSFFRIGSAASCGAAPVSAERTVEVSAFLQ